FGFLGPRGQTAPTSLAEQIGAYGASGRLPSPARPREREDRAGRPETDKGPGRSPRARALDGARRLAEKVLADNQRLESRIGHRLEAAGMALKPAEWLLLHAAVTIGAGILGLLLGAGSIPVLLLFCLAGAVGPWVYLLVKRSRRLAAFDSGLSDTLQLLAGSLTAGLSLTQAIDTVVREGNEPIASE